MNKRDPWPGEQEVDIPQRDKVTLVEVDDYETGVYINGVCISNGEWSTSSDTVRVICQALGVDFERIMIDESETELLDIYLPDRYAYPPKLPE